MGQFRLLAFLACSLFSGIINCQSPQDEVVITDANWQYEITFAEVTDADDAKPAMAMLSSFFGRTPSFDPEEIKLTVNSPFNRSADELEVYSDLYGFTVTSVSKKDRCKRSNDTTNEQK